MPYHEEMMCEIESITYNPSTQTLTVNTPPHNVPDMAGSTSTVNRLYPDALRVEHWEGARLSTVYSREYGSWTRRRDQER